MANPAVGTSRCFDTLGNFSQILRQDIGVVGTVNFIASGAHCNLFHRRIAAYKGNLAIFSGLVVADQTIDFVLSALLKRNKLVRIGAAITNVANCAKLFVADRADAEGVIDLALADHLFCFWIPSLPRPVQGGHHLLACLSVATQTSLGNLLRRSEGPLKLFEMAVILRRFFADRSIDFLWNVMLA